MACHCGDVGVSSGSTVALGTKLCVFCFSSEFTSFDRETRSFIGLAVGSSPTAVVKALELPKVLVALSTLAGPTADSALLVDVVVKALELPKVLVALSTLAGPTADSALLVDVVVKALELPAVAVWVLPSLGVVAFKTTFGLAVSFSAAVVSLAVSAACGRAVSSAIAVCKPAYIANVELIKTEATPTVNLLIAKCCCFASSFCA